MQVILAALTVNCRVTGILPNGIMVVPFMALGLMAEVVYMMAEVVKKLLCCC